MKKFTSVTGVVAPLQRSDIDTDQIIPAQFLTSVSQEGYGEKLFYLLRQEEKEFPLDQPQYATANILLVEHNFGCGSSREHAVWALRDAGFSVVVGKSFADIFRNNSAKNGLLLVELSEEIIDGMFARATGGELSLVVDLPRQVLVEEDGTEHSFEYDSFRKYCLMNGLDDIDYILARQEEIKKYFDAHPAAYSTRSLV